MLTKRLKVLYFLFAVSGFCGLIYESIWTHYLKLFLGHAAYAQTIVLIVFMGGMALGAWLVSKFTGRIRNLLYGYAAVEFAVGLIAIVFHSLFVAVTDWSFAVIMPAACSANEPCVVQWLVGGLLILPQSILLGATFPLMSGGILRLSPSIPGGKISLLYFLNSLGAAFGVLVAAFALIPAVGLPGTLLTAGIGNILLSVVVYNVAKPRGDESPAVEKASAPDAVADAGRLFLAIALFTGLSSFIYEIAWVRMLSMVLGSSSHSFELMLSSFILGLALGGVWIKSRIDRIADVTRFLAIVQVMMGLFALLTLPVYENTFDLMAWLLRSLAKSEGGYLLFNLASNWLALLVMLPATFCAGMTLPLITYHLLRSRRGEKSIGQVYSANTIGAIVGVILAVHIGLPLLGLKNTLILGATIDIAIGVVLLIPAGGRIGLPKVNYAWSAAGVAGVVFALLFFQIDPLKSASGVFRTGSASVQPGNEVLFHQDGKTATIHVLKTRNDARWITTNGKSDVSVMMDPRRPPISDEATMVLSGALPLMYKPEAKTAAVIGFGSGITTHTLLGSPNFTRVDTIEIEPAMVTGARQFLPINEAAYVDPRSHLIYDDAKSFFARGKQKYDLIVSEPSNPWVSGVSSLFTTEFYRRIKGYLADDGVLVQWVQLYEVNPTVVASILKALQSEFPSYAVHASTSGDMILVAFKGGKIAPDRADVFQMKGVAAMLAHVRIADLDELRSRRVATNVTVAPYVSQFAVPPNSDFFPIVDVEAPKARYMEQDGGEVVTIRQAPIPVMELLENRATQTLRQKYALLPTMLPTHAGQAAVAVPVMNALLKREGFDEQTAGLLRESLKDVELFRSQLMQCPARSVNATTWASVLRVAGLLNTSLAAEDSQRIWTAVRASGCFDKADADVKAWVELFQAVGQRDARAMAQQAGAMLAAGRPLSSGQAEYLLLTAVVGHLARGEREPAAQLLAAYLPQLPGATADSAWFKVVVGMVVQTDAR